MRKQYLPQKWGAMVGSGAQGHTVACWPAMEIELEKAGIKMMSLLGSAMPAVVTFVHSAAAAMNLAKGTRAHKSIYASADTL